MLRYVNYDIVFQEVPDEVSLAIQISGCPNKCRACHSAYLMEDIGDELTTHVLNDLLQKYRQSVTCVCFMGGDANPCIIQTCAQYIKNVTNGGMKVAWYSGRRTLDKSIDITYFDYIKLGPYIPERGGLDSPTTNQRFYAVQQAMLIDKTYCFAKEFEYV